MTSSALFAFNEATIRQLSFGLECANSYVIEHDGHVIMIDACSAEVVSEIGEPDYIILTHEHCDHLWGLNVLRDAYPNAKVIAQEKCSEAITSPKANIAKQYHIYAVLRYGESYQNEEARNRRYYCNPADAVFSDRYTFTWHGLDIELCHTPGHSPGSIMISISSIGIFTGDSLILDDETFLKFDGGNEEDFKNITQPLIDAIPDDRIIFPGHGRVFQKKEWKRDNG